MIFVITTMSFALPLWLKNCNDNIGCLTNKIKIATIENSYIQELYYTKTKYYRIHVTYKYNENKKCFYQSYDYSNKVNALNEIEKYPLGTKTEIIINKDFCHNHIESARIMWYIGIIFLSIDLNLLFLNLLILISLRYKIKIFLN